MTYSTQIGIHLGSSKAGLTLNGQLFDTAGVNVGVAITTGFAAIGNGEYTLLASIPDGHRGGIKIYQSGIPGTILASATINPEDGEVAADVWSYTARTLTQTAAQVQAVMQGSTMIAYQDATFDATITGMGDITDRTKLWFTIKKEEHDEDPEAVLQIEETAGLIYIDGKTLAESGLLATDCDIIVDSAPLGNVTLKFEAVAAAMLPASQNLVYDFKVLRVGGDVDMITTGTFHIYRTITDRIV